MSGAGHGHVILDTTYAINKSLRVRNNHDIFHRYAAQIYFGITPMFYHYLYIYIKQKCLCVTFGGGRGGLMPEWNTVTEFSN